MFYTDMLHRRGYLLYGAPGRPSSLMGWLEDLGHEEVVGAD